MPCATSTRRNDFESDSFAFQSGELEAIIKGSMGLVDDNPPPFEESSHSFTEHQSEELPEDPSLRMSFAKWTPEDKQSWTCSVCTFVNEPLHLLCGVCGKAKGEGQVDVSSTSHQPVPEPVPTVEADMGEDYFLEQLRQERHNEVLELQQSILTQAAMEVSAREHSGRDHSAPDYSRRPNFSSRGSFSSIRRSFSRQQTHFLMPKTKEIPTSPTPPGATSQPNNSQECHSMQIGKLSSNTSASLPPPAAAAPVPRAAVPSMRPAESAVYSNVSDAEAKEMRKILSMSQSAPCHTTTTAADTQQTTSLDHQRRLASWDEEDNRNNNNDTTEDDLMAQAMAASLALSDDMDHSERYQGMSSSTPDHHRRGGTSPTRSRLCESNVIGADRRSRAPATSVPPTPSQAMAVDQDIIQKMASRRTSPTGSRMCESNVIGADRRSRATATSVPPTPSQAMAVDQDIIQKMATRSQIRGNNCDDLPGLTSMAQPPAAAAAAVLPGAYQNRPGATPVRNTNSLCRAKEESLNPPSPSKPSAEEEKIKQEEESRKKYKPFLSLRPTPSVRANSGVALDDDMLQMIVNGGCNTEDDDDDDYQGAPSSTGPPASLRTSKDRADMLPKSWKNDEGVTESTKKGGRFKKAAKGLLKTFRKNKSP